MTPIPENNQKGLQTLMEVKKMNRRPSGVVSFELCFEGKEWENALSKVSVSRQEKAPIAGCRVGKAPLPLAYKTYGSDLIDEAAKSVIGGALATVIAENQLAPVSQPTVSYMQADLTCLHVMCSFVNYPEIPDFDYIGIPVERPVKICTEEDINRSIDAYLKKHLYVHEVDRPAAMGDIVEVDFRGTHDGQPFPFDQSDNNRFTMGSGVLFTGLDEALAGHLAGDHLHLQLTMPEDFHREEIRGFTLDLDVNLHGVWAREEVSECTDAYVHASVGGCETVAEFRQRQRQNIQRQYDNQSRQCFEDKVQTALASRITTVLPESMYEVGIRQAVNDLARNAPAETWKNETPDEREKRMARYREQARPVAERQVRLSVALDYVICHEKIQTTLEEIDAYVNAYASAMHLTPDDALRRLGGKETVAEEMQNNRLSHSFATTLSSMISK